MLVIMYILKKEYVSVFWTESGMIVQESEKMALWERWRVYRRDIAMKVPCWMF